MPGEGGVIKGYRSILDVDECILYLDCDMDTLKYTHGETEEKYTQY